VIVAAHQPQHRDRPVGRERLGNLATAPPDAREQLPVDRQHVRLDLPAARLLERRGAEDDVPPPDAPRDAVPETGQRAEDHDD
jgi:hypothetical protein